MRLPKPSTSASWLKITVVPITVTLLGGNCWYSHWDAKLRRSRRCGGLSCALCQCGQISQVRYVFLVQTEYGDECWLELRAPHYSTLLEFQDLHGDLVGMKLQLYRDSTNSNARVMIDFAGRVPGVVERNVSGFVDRLGLPPLPALQVGTARSKHGSARARSVPPDVA